MKMLIPDHGGVRSPRACLASSFQAILLLPALAPSLCFMGLWCVGRMVFVQDQK